MRIFFNTFTMLLPGLCRRVQNVTLPDFCENYNLSYGADHELYEKEVRRDEPVARPQRQSEFSTSFLGLKNARTENSGYDCRRDQSRNSCKKGGNSPQRLFFRFGTQHNVLTSPRPYNPC